MKGKQIRKFLSTLGAFAVFLFFVFLFFQTEVAAVGTYVCVDCCGTGTTGIYISKRCSDCYGMGYTSENVGATKLTYYCSPCHGTGYVKEAVSCDICSGDGTLTGSLITYDAAGGTNAPVAQVKAEGESLILQWGEPVCDGCVFMGWSSTPNSSVEYAPGDKYDTDVDVTLYAVWHKACSECDAAGEIVTSYKCENCDGEGTIIGRADCSYCTEGIVMVSTSYKCTRCWGGKIGVVDPDCYICGGDGLLVTTAGKKCHVCNGAGDTKKEFGCPICVGEGVEYTYSQCNICEGAGENGVAWIVSYDANGGENAPQQQIKRSETPLQLTTQAPKRSGYAFMGWALSPDGPMVYQPGDQYKLNARLMLYAIWEPLSTYEIHYDANGGAYFSSGSTFVTQTKYHGEIFYTTNCDYPERSGYRFMGWSEAPCGEGAYVFQCTEDRNYLLYAVWQPFCTQCDGSGCDLCDEGVLPSDAGHVYDDGTVQTEPSCSNGGSRLYTCKLCGTTKSEHIQPLDHIYGDWVVEQEPACKNVGYQIRTCTRCGGTSGEYIPSLGHDYYEEGNVVSPTCTGWGYTWHICRRCGENAWDSYVGALGHSYGDWEVVRKATCTQEGKRRHTCIRCGTEETEASEPTGHIRSDWIIDQPAGCETLGEKHIECTVCRKGLDSEVIPKNGHTLSDWIIDVVPTCTEAGEKHTQCVVCLTPLQTEVIPQNGHDETDWIIDRAATCTQQGSKHTECLICGETVSERSISTASHSYEWSTTAPTCEEMGYDLGICSVCSWHRYINEVPALEHDWDAGTLTVQPTLEKEGIRVHTCTRCDEVKKEKIPKLSKPMDFTDVPVDAYYTEPVAWAVAEGITLGTSETTFSPNESCTRAQVVTFLWRAADSPVPTSSTNPFTDVKPGAYYYDAVLWAVQEGITEGTSATTFSPEDTCTRGQIVTFLWRYEGKPAPKADANPFNDVKSNSYYYDAVLWAVERGVTKGTATTTFSPEDKCTRAQVVTFLYRDVTA